MEMGHAPEPKQRNQLWIKFFEKTDRTGWRQKNGIVLGNDCV